MDFNNGLYVFNGIPGFDASKGERIVKALRKLQTKIKHLEHEREHKRDTSTKEAETDNAKDLTLSDIRLKLLEMQIQHVRNVLRKDSPKLSHPSENENMSGNPESLHPGNILYGMQSNHSQETQTGTSLCEPYVQQTISCDFDSHHEEEKSVEHGNSSNQEAAKSRIPNDQLPNESVPFILGASSTPSHNLLANKQYLHATLKNKALCNPRFPTSRKTTPLESTRIKCSSHDTNKIINKLVEELSELQIKQENLVVRFDTAQRGNHFVDVHRNKPIASTGTIKRETKKKHVASSNSNANVSSALSKETKYQESIKENKHAVPTNRMQANMPKRLLLRSLQELNTRLTEDDISWV